MPRYLLLLCLAACGDNLPPETDQPSGSIGDDNEVEDPPRDPHPDPAPDAGADACPPSDGSILFQTATVGPPPYATQTGYEVSIIQMPSARFTTTQTHTITGLGGFFTRSIGSAEVFVAIVPLEANGYPASETLSNAIGFGSGTVSGPPQDYTFATSFTLPPGTYGLVAGSGRLGVANNDASVNGDVDAVGSPDFFFWHGDNQPGYWSEAQVSGDPYRLFIVGN